MVPQGPKRFGRLSIVSLPPGEITLFVREKAQPTGTPLPQMPKSAVLCCSCVGMELWFIAVAKW
jgi:hypothetical protein